MSITFMIIGTMLIVGGIPALWRFASLHVRGTPVIARRLPTGDGSHWRRRVVVYSESTLKMYKLRSLHPGSDAEIARHGVSAVDRRDPTDIEAGFFAPGLRIVRIRTGKNTEWEFAVDSPSDTVLVAQVESKLSSCQTREFLTDIERRFRSARYRGRGGQYQALMTDYC